MAYINVDISVFGMGSSASWGWAGKGRIWVQTGFLTSSHSQCYPPGTGDTPCTKRDFFCHQRGTRGCGGSMWRGAQGLQLIWRLGSGRDPIQLLRLGFLSHQMFLSTRSVHQVPVASVSMTTGSDTPTAVVQCMAWSPGEPRNQKGRTIGSACPPSTLQMLFSSLF